MTDIEDELSYLGPVRVLWWEFRVSLRDVREYDGSSEWTVALQRRRLGGRFRSVKKTSLYPEGRKRQRKRTEPSESEAEHDRRIDPFSD